MYIVAIVHVCMLLTFTANLYEEMGIADTCTLIIEQRKTLILIHIFYSFTKYLSQVS